MGSIFLRINYLFLSLAALCKHRTNIVPSLGHRGTHLLSSVAEETPTSSPGSFIPVLAKHVLMLCIVRFGHPILKRTSLLGEVLPLEPGANGSTDRQDTRCLLFALTILHDRALVTLFCNWRAFTLFLTMTHKRKSILHCKPVHTDIYTIDTDTQRPSVGVSLPRTC